MIRSTVLLLVFAVAGALDAAPRLSTVPSRVYRINDESKFGTESWYFELIVHDPEPRKWEPSSLKLETLSAGKVVKSLTMSAPALAALRRQAYKPTADLPKTSMRRHFSIADEVFDLPLVFSERRAPAIDQLKATLTLVDGKTTIERTLTVPIERYEQRTKLTFPFKGPGIVTQGQFNNGGHAHRQTMFAIDVMALNPLYGPMLSEEETNETVAGWGKEILAPADGTVAYSRNDVPTNPLFSPDEKTYSALPEPVWANGGNCVVIDHGNGEFSALMHMQAGSVTVRKGDAVKRGQVVGKMGNSGDSYMPHLHYQLMNGPLIFASDGLPFVFENLADKTFTRGTYFTAR